MGAARSFRAARIALAATLVAVALATALPSVAAGCRAEQQQLAFGTATWTVRGVPEFPGGRFDAVAFAADGDALLVTDSVDVMRSPDGGCTWRAVYEAPAGLRVHRIAMGHGVAHMLLAAEPEPGTVAPAPGAFATSSFDGGATWSDPQLLPGSGAVGPVLIGGRSVAYAASGSAIWVTRDGGGSWHALGIPSDPPAEPDVEQEVRTLHLQAGRLWVKSSFALYESADEGRTWTRRDAATDPIGPGAFGPVAFGESSMMFLSGQYRTSPVRNVHFSGDGGRSFRVVAVSKLGGPIAGVPVAAASRDGEAMIATALPGTADDHAAYRWDRRGGRFVDVDRFGLGPFMDVAAGARGGSFYLLRKTTIVRYDDGGVPPPPSPRELPPLVRIPAFEPPAPPPIPPAGFDVPVTSIALGAGASRDFDVAVSLPAIPTPLDVFFLVDTTGSQTPSVRGLALGIASIARAVSERGIDAHYGLGEFRDVDSLRYRLRANIGPPGRAFQHALERLYTDGGKPGDQNEQPQITALHQVATGSGLPAAGDVPPVPRGQDARWRPGSLRVVVLISDEPFGEDPNGPRYDEMLAALRADGVRVVGIEVNPPAEAEVFDNAGRTFASTTRVDFERVARDTGAFAPEGGVDCTRNGTREVAAGSPMVCSIPIDDDANLVHLAEPLIAVLSSLEDRQRVRLVAEAPSGIAVTTDPAAGFAGVDVKQTSSHRFGVRVACGSEHVPSSPVLLRVVVAAREVAERSVGVACGAPPPADARPAPVRPLVGYGSSAASASVPGHNQPPQPVNAGGLGQTQVNPAPREEEEPETNEEYSFTAVRHGRAANEPPYAAGLALFACFGVALTLEAVRRRRFVGAFEARPDS